MRCSGATRATGTPVVRTPAPASIGRSAPTSSTSPSRRGGPSAPRRATVRPRLRSTPCLQRRAPFGRPQAVQTSVTPAPPSRDEQASARPSVASPIRVASAEVRIWLTQGFGPTRAAAHPLDAVGRGCQTNAGSADGDLSPLQPMRSTFCWHTRAKVERVKIRAGRRSGT
jgi:hypothetical protein